VTAVQTRLAPAPAPGPRAASAHPTSAPRARPPLRLVGEAELAARARRRRARVMTVLTLALVVAGLFGLVASHVVLTQGQFRLQQLQARADAEQGRYERLRLQVARLESPERIVAAAQERLGMVPPAGVRYLSPVGAVSTPARPAPASARRVDAAAPSTSDWSAVKRRLASRP